MFPCVSFVVSSVLLLVVLGCECLSNVSTEKINEKKNTFKKTTKNPGVSLCRPTLVPDTVLAKRYSDIALTANSIIMLFVIVLVREFLYSASDLLAGYPIASVLKPVLVVS